MSRQEVFDYLKKQQEMVDSREISKGVGISVTSVTNCLKELRESRIINFREAELKNKFEYKCGERDLNPCIH
ncbi:hypothetical protein FP803_00075 [Candidatus Woesearchaeota archaeon]|nr:hypothetical protein [Candidatus Woesearchaeota archaeon]